MQLADALAVLGVKPGTPLERAHSAYLALVRSTHPDTANAAGAAAAHEQTARLTHAWAVVSDAGTTDLPTAATTPGSTGQVAPATDSWGEAIAAEKLAGDTLLIDAPPDEVLPALLDAASQVGNLAYIDRQLGIVEAIVRFEGGPSCSLLLTMQGRAYGTEVFCTLESIEARPAPPLAPVVEALVEALRGR